MALINFIWWAAVTFLTLGFVEAVVKPIAKRWVQRRILAAAPAVFKHLDTRLPQLLAITDASGVDAYVRALFEEVTGEDWSKDNLDPFFELFDLRIAADAGKVRE